MSLLQRAEVDDGACEEFDPDAAAAAHYQVLGREVFAAQSVFLSVSGRRGGDEVARVLATYARCGFTPPPMLESDDLACQLAALAHLCAAEAESWEDNLAAIANSSCALQAQLLDDHLLRWLPALSEALQRQPFPLYARSAALLLGVVDDHVDHLGATMPAPTPLIAIHTPDPRAADTRLREIADWLLAPVCAGFLLTHGELQAIAAGAVLPHGFVDRHTMLMDMLRAAGAADALPALLTALEARATQATTAYARMAEEWVALKPWVAPWITRVARTTEMLAWMYKHEMGLRFCGMVEEEPRPGA